MAARMAPRFRELTDVDWSSFEDGEVATYDSGTDSLTGEPGGGDAVADLATHAADTTNVHGIADTTVLASDAELAAHIADTTFVHGVPNTSDLATDAEVASAVSTHSSDTTSVHGITDTTVLATDAEVSAAVSAHESDTTVHGVDTANVPSSDQKAALAGTSGTPSVSNRFVTEDDPAVGAADLSAILDANGYVFTKKTSEPADGDLAVGEAVWWLDDTHYAPAFKIKTLDGTVVSYSFDQVPNQNWLSEPGELFVGALSGVEEGDLTITILAPGTNGQVLTADDTVLDKGVKWATPTGGVDQGDIDDTVATHSADTTSVHGIADTSVLATDAEVATAVSDHSADTTSVHGIADTSALATLPIAEANVTGLTAALAAKQPIDSDLTSLAALTTTSFGRGLLELANQGALLTAAGAAAASHSHAESDVTNLTTDLAGKQPLDTDLTAIAALTSAADKLAYATGSGTWALADLSSFARTVLDDTTAAAARTTLGVTIPYGVENGQAGLIAPTTRGWGVLNNSITAQRCFLTRFVPSRDLAVTKVAYIQGSAGGAGDAVDVGIYNSGLTTKLGSTGAITPGNSTTGIKVGTLTGTVNLTAGTVYYAAFVAATGATGSTANATLSAGGSGLNLAFGTAIGTFESAYKDIAANTLPASIATPTAHETQGPIFAIRES